jgi:hypothetical protein
LEEVGEEWDQYLVVEYLVANLVA